MSSVQRVPKSILFRSRLERGAQRSLDPVANQRVSDLIRANIFESFRERIIYPLATITSLVCVPFAVSHYHEGHIGLAMLLIAVVVMIIVDAIAVYVKAEPPVPYSVLLVAAAGSVGLTLATRGIYGALWCFPAVMVSYFVFHRRAANLAAVGMLVIATSMIHLHEEVGTTIRFALSLTFCIVIVNILLDVLDAVHSHLLSQSLTDPLTGAFNRRHMDTSLRNMLERHARTGAAASALIVDIDHFKRINDDFGHEAGDMVLKTIVDLIDERSRKLDMVFRIGGEEFLVLLPDTRVSQARIVAEHLRATISRAGMIDGRPVTVSIGVSELAGGDEPSSWLKRADAALYRAKESGRDRVMA